MPYDFVTGPVRSGKSRFAQGLARAQGRPVVYVATAAAYAGDEEWQRRIARHRADRPASWTVVETAAEPRRDLAKLLRDADERATYLVDSIGTWLADGMVRLEEGEAAAREAALEKESDALADALDATRAHAIVVGEETGWSIVPEHPSARLFRDVAGRLQQRLARRADRAYLVVAGFALDLHALGVAVR